MPLDAREKIRVRTHLGYLNVSPAASLFLGIPRPIQTIFLVEQAMSNLIEDAVERVRKILGVMDGVECRLVESQERLAASKLGELELRQNEPDLLEREYVRWGGRLADELGVPFYAYSNRYKWNQPMAGGFAGSIPVYNG